MHFMWAAVIGFLAGAIANRLRPGHDGRHMLSTAGVGIVAAIIAFGIGRVLHFKTATEHPSIGLYLSVGMMWTLIAVAAFVVSRSPTRPATDR
jgi:uncharacterized membrane protein YeaQ/YmgE (transglycosylase-associated protein family)